jgi:hypothetical protein
MFDKLLYFKNNTYNYFHNSWICPRGIDSIVRSWICNFEGHNCKMVINIIFINNTFSFHIFFNEIKHDMLIKDRIILNKKLVKYYISWFFILIVLLLAFYFDCYSFGLFNLLGLVCHYPLKTLYVESLWYLANQWMKQIKFMFYFLS